MFQHQWRQPCQPDDAADVAVGGAFLGSQIGERGDFAAFDQLSPTPSKKSFASWNTGEHLHSAIRVVTPNERHAGQDSATLANRAIVYANAGVQKPERRSGKIRNWQAAGRVWLNPENRIERP